MRKSIDSRMDRIVDRLLPPGSMERREYFLTPDMKASLAQYRQSVGAAIDNTEDAGAALLDGTLQIPDMPYALKRALGLSDDAPIISEDMSVNDAARLYADFVQCEV